MWGKQIKNTDLVVLFELILHKKQANENMFIFYLINDDNND